MSPNTALFAPPTYHLLGKSSPTGSSSTRATHSTAKKEKAAAATVPSPRAARAPKAGSPAEPLPEECEALKQKIRQIHPEKTSRFSLSHMKRVAIPPVDIPTNFTNAPTIVAGKPVLFTKTCWMRRKHELRLMRRIRENEELR